MTDPRLYPYSLPPVPPRPSTDTDERGPYSVLASVPGTDEYSRVQTREEGGEGQPAGRPELGPEAAPLEGSDPELAEWVARLARTCPACGCKTIGDDGRCARCGATKRSLARAVARALRHARPTHNGANTASRLAIASPRVTGEESPRSAARNCCAFHPFGRHPLRAPARGARMVRAACSRSTCCVVLREEISRGPFPLAVARAWSCGGHESEHRVDRVAGARSPGCPQRGVRLSPAHVQRPGAHRASWLNPGAHPCPLTF